jgi:hypothetical protein
MPKSVFAKYHSRNYPHRFTGTLHLGEVRGGTPGDPKVIEGWIKRHLGAQTSDLVRAQVAETMVERGVTAEEAADVLAHQLRVNAFKQDKDRGLYLEGRHLKACLKEAASVANNEARFGRSRWGAEEGGTRAGITHWFPEHVFVMEDRLYFDRAEPDGVDQRFVPGSFQSGWKSSIKYEQFLQDVSLDFTIETDHAFTAEEWGVLWTTAEHIGLGASRSQGYGRFTVITWDPVKL